MSKPEKIQKEVVLSQRTPDSTVTLSPAEACLYALGVGYSKDPLNDKDLAYTYERHDDFQLFPTMSTCITQKAGGLDLLFEAKGIPEFNPMGLLHGEQRTEVYQQLQADVEYTVKGRVVDILDKKSGAVFVMLSEVYDANNLVMRNYYFIFVKGLGGFAPKDQAQVQPYSVIKQVPKSNPDLTFIQPTEPNSAILYRLSGDFNPLHIDPQMAAMGNFPKPILHGLCTYGIVAKTFVQQICGGDQQKLRAIHSRFTSHVFPGETLVIQFWKNGNIYAFNAKTKERGLQVIIGEIHTQMPNGPKL